MSVLNDIFDKADVSNYVICVCCFLQRKYHHSDSITPTEHRNNVSTSVYGASCPVLKEVWPDCYSDCSKIFSFGLAGIYLCDVCVIYVLICDIKKAEEKAT